MTLDSPLIKHRVVICVSVVVLSKVGAILTRIVDVVVYFVFFVVHMDLGTLIVHHLFFKRR